ncbi:hypothetical protein [Oryza sativa Japonica Group]|uniref:Ubiquitin-like protease family profile domain-containing protein n=1 Tax=Oryza sativa subsp. japonica TaxID=39947 RepID=Q5QMA5_ORYSJ|nr:hypothetical protein [Oryza sativa Japonica Group]
MESVHAEVHNSTDHIDVGDVHVLDANAHNQFASGAVQNEQQTSPCCNHDVDSYVPLENDLPDNVPLAGNFDNAGDFNCASGYLPSMNTGNASTSVVNDGIAESFGDGQALVTPDVGCAKNFKNSSDERFSASAIATAAAAVKHVAIKFKSRLPQFNGSENVDRAVDMFKPSYKNLFPQDNAGISFHSVEDTPEELIQIKHNHEGTARTPNSGIIKKRVDNFQNLWNKFVGSSLDFSVFKTVFPPVPRQDYESDSGVFVMKFMEIWSPRILLPNEFSKQNINNIRVKYVNQIFFHAKNKMLHTEIEDAVLNWFNPEKFARQ